MTKAERNERRKLSANYANGVAIAMIAVGGFAPLAAIVQTGNVNAASLVLFVICFVGSGSLHLFALKLLAGMED